MSIIVLNTLVDIYSKPDAKGIQKIIKRNVECKKTFDTNTISVEQHIKANGEVSKKWCNIKENENYYKIGHSFEYVHNLINQPQLFISGYKRWNK